MNSPHLRSPRAPVSESIVIDLDPVPVGVLQVHLLDLVGAYLGLFTTAGPVPVFNIILIQVFW